MARYEETGKSGFGTASLVLGIIGVVFSFIPILSYVSFILGGLALIFGIVCLCKRASKGIAIAGVILAIISLYMAYSMHNGLKTAVNEVSSGLNEVASSLEVDQDSEDKMTLSKFNQIENGMTYEEVVAIIGSEGTLSTESSYGNQTMQVYYWYASNGISNATVSFINGKVTAKSQIGLE